MSAAPPKKIHQKDDEVVAPPKQSKGERVCHICSQGEEAGKKRATKSRERKQAGGRQADGRSCQASAKKAGKPKKGEELLLRLLLLRGKRLKGRREELVPEGNKKANKRRLERPKGLRRSGGIFCACQDRQEP